MDQKESVFFITSEGLDRKERISHKIKAPNLSVANMRRYRVAYHKKIGDICIFCQKSQIICIIVIKKTISSENVSQLFIILTII
ncbi:MAG: hypothetical protein ACFE9L_11090 [Candidatus Hodarchaeota archaeon]